MAIETDVSTSTTDGRVNPWVLGSIAVALVAGVVAILALGITLATRNGVGVASGSGVTGAVASAPSGEKVTAVLTEFAIDMPTEVLAGSMIEVVNEGEVPHNLRIDGDDLGSADLATGETDEFDLGSLAPGTYTFVCDIPGHATAGMEFEVTLVGDTTVAAEEGPQAGDGPEQPSGVAEPTTADRVAAEANSTGTPVGDRAAQTVPIELTTSEREGQLADGSTYTYWTFDDQVPGPMLRVREGDTVELTLNNDEDSVNVHSIDLHAVNGPHGGGGLQVAPGETGTFTFTALNPGVYVYHCATPHVPSHIANGMYGLIVVEPEGGLPEVDREFYVMQGELYTAQDHGAPGLHTYDGDAMQDEDPTYVVFNGQDGAVTGDHAMQAQAGETIRLFVGNGGPNLTSSFHVIGEIFDRVPIEGGAIINEDVQTTLIPAGGATWVEFTVDAPGDYILVDHAITRAIDKGAVAILHVTGDPNPAVFEGSHDE